MLTILKQLRDNVADTVRDQQIDDLIDSFINLTGLEIHNFHTWTYLRDKQTFPTVASQEDYNLDSEVDRIALLRERSTRTKIAYLPDHLFYRLQPDPEGQTTTNPYIYRLWVETGFSTNLAADDTIYVVSSSASDGSSFNVQVVGRNSSGEVISENLILNGTTNVTSATTFESAGLMRISKSATTTGTISCRRTTGDTLLSELEPDNLAPRFKRLGLYPIPSSVLTMNLEYYRRYRYLVNDTDVPQMDVQWNWVLREGALAKTWEYKQNEVASALHQALFDRGLKLMRSQDEENLDYVPSLQPRIFSVSRIRRNSDSVSGNFPGYSLRL